MPTIKQLFFFVVLFCSKTVFSQAVEISGIIASSVGLENIHVINSTAQIFTITDSKGAFKIPVRLHDTLSFSSIQHKTKKVVVDKNTLLFKTVTVILKEQITELDEVRLGKILTGDLLSDIKNTDGKPPINFYDVGIPGYTGKPATQSERRLSEASDLSPKAGGSLGGAGGSVSAIALINAITGRTKMLKARVALEEKDALMQRIKSRLGTDFFAENPMKDYLKNDFFYFCADDELFIKTCKNQTDFNILVFLKQKYNAYMQLQKTTKN